MGFLQKSGKWGGMFFFKWTFPQRRVHYVQYQYFLFYILLIWGSAYAPIAPSCLQVCVHIKFTLRYISTVKDICQFCNKLLYIIKFGEQRWLYRPMIICLYSSTKCQLLWLTWSLFSLCLYFCLRCCVFVLLPYFRRANKDLYKYGVFARPLRVELLHRCNSA